MPEIFIWMCGNLGDKTGHKFKFTSFVVFIPSSKKWIHNGLFCAEMMFIPKLFVLREIRD